MKGTVTHTLKILLLSKGLLDLNPANHIYCQDQRITAFPMTPDANFSDT